MPKSIATTPTAQSQSYPQQGVTLKLPEYGYIVQEMVAYACTIVDKAARQAYAEMIVKVMTQLSTANIASIGFIDKVWNHLAFMANYALDIDYPCPIIHHDVTTIHPQRIAYPDGHMRMRHYGKLLESAMAQLHQLPEGPARQAYEDLLTNRMKAVLNDQKGYKVHDEKIKKDLAAYFEP